ncbi:armadillo-type protein [Gilbertella persicaria]|uniref:armadillo-type protein n=1 Tax=Gilbertella persicaria TaxID=101096 RepID=UPI00221F80F5|nr:armadillo-type protein [Gilbertella persicaria]KAI8090914.1 armadillo-type protein [Gilbertella persicaria]
MPKSAKVRDCLSKNDGHFNLFFLFFFSLSISLFNTTITMGKQVRKSVKRRTNPLGPQVTAGVQQGVIDQQITLQPDQVLPVVQKLSSLDPTERGWAASSISNLVLSSPANLKLLLSKGVVGNLIKLLSDDTREVVEEALGTLRNLCAIDPDVCREYFSKDILTPLNAMLPQISKVIDLVLKNEPLADNADQDRRASIWDVAENFIYIIWSLSETSEKYIKAINRLNIVTFLISFLSAADQCPNKVVVAAGQCLTTLTDDNKDIYIEFQNHPEYIQTLLNILNKFESPDKLLVRVLACAILMNVREVVQLSNAWDDERDALHELHKMVLPPLMACLDYDIQKAAEETKAVIDSGDVTKHEESTEITPKPKQPLTKGDTYIQNVQERLVTLQLALELLADVCSQDDAEDDGWEDAGEDMEEDGDAEAMADNLNEDNVDEYLRDAENLGEGTSNIVEESAIKSNPILNGFTSSVFPHLLRLAAPTVLSFPQDRSVAPGVTQGLTLTHQRALECLNNFLLAMNEVPSKFWFKEYVSDASNTWTWLFSTANTIGSAPDSEERNEVLEAIVGCLWALGRGLGGNIPLEPTHVPTLCGAFRATNSESMQVKIVGCLGSIAVRQGDISTNKEIGIFIMNVLSNINTHTTKPDVAVEALNFMFDVYSDCAFDYDEPVFVQGKFNYQLKQIVPAFRSMVKSTDKRKSFDLRNRCDEALMNLVAFIKYKASERR